MRYALDGIHPNDRGTWTFFGREYHWVAGYRLVPGPSLSDVGSDFDRALQIMEHDHLVANR